MSIETNLVALLKTVCPRVSPDVAALSTPRPFITYQHIGGTPLRYMDNTPTDLRHAVIQVAFWGDTRAQCLDLARQTEELLCGASVFVAEPVGELLGTADEDLKLYGHSQDFSIAGPR